MQRLSGNRELLSELIKLYLEDYHVLLERIQSAAEEGDPVSLARGAHSLKGLASNFDGLCVVDAADETIQAARTDSSGPPNEEMANLSNAAKELAEKLKESLEQDDF